MSDLQLVLTEDGSHTLYNPRLNEHYHSTHGALQESMHVFIEAGLKEVCKQTNTVHILEIGFGTGLNCMLTLEHSMLESIRMEYTALEPCPLKPEMLDALNHPSLRKTQSAHALFRLIHSEEEGDILCTEHFHLCRHKQKLEDFVIAGKHTLIYFDAFAPGVQPELWTAGLFKKLFDSLEPGGILVTYCAKGEVKRNMKAAGFLIERLPGPPGKREMTRCRKAS